MRLRSIQNQNALPLIDTRLTNVELELIVTQDVSMGLTSALCVYRVVDGPTERANCSRLNFHLVVYHPLHWLTAFRLQHSYSLECAYIVLAILWSLHSNSRIAWMIPVYGVSNASTRLHHACLCGV